MVNSKKEEETGTGNFRNDVSKTSGDDSFFGGLSTMGSSTKKIRVLIVFFFFGLFLLIPFAGGFGFFGLGIFGYIMLFQVLIFLAGAGMFVSGLVWLRRRMLIQNTPTSKIRSIAMGLVEITGKAAPWEKTLKAPLTGEDCVYFKYVIEEYRGGKNSRWVTVGHGAERTGFFIEDDTGRVLVEPRGAEIDVADDFEYESGAKTDPPPKVLEFLEKNGIGHEGFFGGNKLMRFTEYHIAPGDVLYVMGTAGDNPHVEEGSALRNDADIMIQKGSFDKFFYISDKKEKELLKSLKRKSVFSLAFGAIIIVAELLFVMPFFNFF
jgi:hypothetical protein